MKWSELHTKIIKDAEYNIHVPINQMVSAMVWSGYLERAGVPGPDNYSWTSGNWFRIGWERVSIKPGFSLGIAICYITITWTDNAITVEARNARKELLDCYKVPRKRHAAAA